METNLTINDQTQRTILSSVQSNSDRTGLFIALFLLFLLFILISYLFYSFLSIRHYSTRPNTLENNTLDENLNNKIIFNDNDDLIDNNGDIIFGPKSSFSDCGTSIRSSSIHSSRFPQAKRSSSYKLCSQASNYLLTPRLSSQFTTASIEEGLSPTIIIEPNDVHLANALSRSISKYYERKRKPKLKRRTHSCEELMNQTQAKHLRPLQLTASLPMHRNLRQSTVVNYQQPQKHTSQTSFRKKPTTIYELYKSDRMRISNLLVSDS
ncbi:hypothetical protein I4U23_008143 [Adineta vaga]|nr:hypothetical protein I4U23_008143 [Adineta vaga]